VKEFIFISDFDGTLTNKDFYHIVMEEYLADRGEALYQSWRRNEIGVSEFLAGVFRGIDRDETEIDEAITKIAVDGYLKEFITRIQAAGGDFLILSAGTDYYIKRTLKNLGLAQIPVISNPGVYHDRGIKVTPDQESPYYSKVYGVDKALAVQDYLTKYRRVFYAGDSEPDLKAALLAEQIFARGELVELLTERRRAFVPFKSFVEIGDYLQQIGVIK